MHSSDTRNWAMACHAAAFAGFIMPFGNVIGPLIVWLMKREEDPFIDASGKEALNFQITMMIGYLVAALLMIVLVGFILLPALALVNLILVILAMLRTSEGELYRYPFSLQLVK